jgi:hypothetical protein
MNPLNFYSLVFQRAGVLKVFIKELSLEIA